MQPDFSVYLQWRAALQFRLSANPLQLQSFPPPFATLVGSRCTAHSQSCICSRVTGSPGWTGEGVSPRFAFTRHHVAAWSIRPLPGAIRFLCSAIRACCVPGRHGHIKEIGLMRCADCGEAVKADESLRATEANVVELN